jgi:hypothetical protein
MSNIDNSARLVEGMINCWQCPVPKHRIKLIQSRNLRGRLNDRVGICMGRVPNTESIIAECAIAVLVDRHVNVTVVEVVVRKIPVCLVKSRVGVS